MYDIVIKNGQVITASTTFQADVAIQGETIAAIGQSLSGERELEAAGKLVLPGGGGYSRPHANASAWWRGL